jgi:protoporphyrinogen oxidase
MSRSGNRVAPIGGHVAVVGGGILGMFLALRLRQAGAQVTLLESAAHTGGLADAKEIGGYTWDRFYHVVLLSDLHTRALLDELGIGDRLRWGVTRTGFYTDGKLYSLSNNLEFLRFPPLSLADKLRLGATIFLASRIKDGRSLEQTLVEEWLTRLSGRRVVERIWLPLLKSKLGDNYRIANASFIWAIIARMYAARRSGLKREMFGYVDGGYDLVLKTMQRRLDELGVQTRYGARVTRIHDSGSGVQVHTAGGDVMAFDRLVATVPTGAIAAACPQLTTAEKARLQGVVYQGIVCASMLLKRPISSFYVTNVTDRWVPFTGVIEMTSLVDRERFDGKSLVYLPCYLTQDDPYWERSDAEVQEDFVGALERMYPHFTRADVVAFKVARARQVLAVSTLGYTERWLPPVRTSLPNVSVVNSAQIVNGTLNVNETLGVVHEQLPELLRRLVVSRAPQPAGR